jgi:hypothetical protein
VRELLFRKDWRALRLAALTVGDLVVVRAVPSRYGKHHLDALGVPPEIQRLLPVIKGLSAIALVVGAKRPALRSLTGAALAPYYSAAVTFHILSGDGWQDTAPAALYGLEAAAIV